LILWRHGTTQANEDGVFVGQRDVPLSPAGCELAAEAAVKLASWRPQRIVSSDLIRAQQTANLLSELIDRPVICDARLREIYLGTWQGLTPSEALIRHPEEYAAWQRGKDISRGGGETFEIVADRASQVIDAHLEGNDTQASVPIVLVTHAGTVRALVGHLLDLPLDLWSRIAMLENCAWCALGRGGRGWELLSYNVASLRTYF
jgi:glucosyl-3-phosphoglycerate phosphatase